MPDGSLIFDTRVDTDNFENSTRNISGQVDRLDSKFKNLAITVAKAFVIKGIFDFGKQSIELASDLNEVQNVVDTTFGKMSSDINNWSQNALEKFGLNELTAKQFTSTMGAMLKSSGMTNAMIKDMSIGLAGLAGDMASFYNLKPEEAFDKLRAGISGETEPLKQLGINMSVANLEAYALSQGIDTAYNSMSQAEQTTLRYNYIMSATKDAQGDFAKTSGSFANQQKLLAEKFKQLGADIGAVLLPVILKFVKILSGGVDVLMDISNWCKEHKALATLIAAAIGIITVAIIAYNIALNAATIATTIATAASATFGAVLGFITSPITLIVVAIGLVIVAIVLLVKNFDKVKQAFSDLWDKIKDVCDKMVDGIKGILSKIASFFINLWDGIVKGFKNVVNFIIKGLNKIVDGINTFLKILLAPINLLIKGINLIPGINIPKVELAIPHIPEIPMMAKGGILPYGSAIVGEAGAELLTIKNGKAHVQPLNKNAQNAFSPVSSGQQVTIEKVVIDAHNVEDFNKVVNMVLRQNQARRAY